MRIVRFSNKTGPSYGVLDADEITPVDGDIFSKWTLQDTRLALDEVHLHAPMQPPNILAIGRNYREHARERGAKIPKTPNLFVKANTALADPEQPILLPNMAPDEVDYEAELAVVIGKRAHNISEKDASQFILGYTCGNDVTARDCQREDGQWARGKSFDTFAPLGPWIETELDPDTCNISLRLNGRTMQDSNTKDLIFNSRQLVSYLSRCMTLLPGTVIMTGTPAGVGAARRPPIFLSNGDVTEVEVEGIGVLRNSVVSETVRDRTAVTKRGKRPRPSSLR